MNEADVRRAGSKRMAELGSAFALLTRLPMPRAAAPGADAVWAYPLVGAVVGGLGGAVYWLALGASCPPALASLWALAALILITGALHEDGLADFADSLGGTTRPRSLAIMRDHRIGTYGVLALILALAIRATAIALIGTVGGVLVALIAAGAASRLAAVLVMAALAPARAEGLSASVGRPSTGSAVLTLALTFAIAWLLLPFALALLVTASAALAAFAIGAIAQKRLGGQTGDVLGAASMLAECLILTALAAG